MYNFYEKLVEDCYPSGIKLTLTETGFRLTYNPIKFNNPDDISRNIKRVIFNDPATIVFWKDGTKTVVKCCENDTYNKEVGLMACIIKYLTGNTGRWNEIMKRWTKDEDN